MAYQRIRYGEWRLPIAAARHAARPPIWSRRQPGRPKPPRRRAWLNEADALAAQGRIFKPRRSIICWSGLSRISREVAAAPGQAGAHQALSLPRPMPSRPPRAILFAGIARLVEKSLLGGRPVDARDWDDGTHSLCRFRLARDPAHMSDIAIGRRVPPRGHCVPGARTVVLILVIGILGFIAHAGAWCLCARSPVGPKWRWCTHCRPPATGFSGLVRLAEATGRTRR